MVGVDWVGTSMETIKTFQVRKTLHDVVSLGSVSANCSSGDANYDDDRILYARGQQWLQQRHIMGRAVGFLPYLGYVTIVMTDKPLIKYAVIGALGLLFVTSKD